MTAQLEARAFAIWRYANSRDWDVSYDEISDATGLTRNEVHSTIKRKGWGGRIGSGAGTVGSSQKASLMQKKKGYRFDENNLDLCQLIGGR